MNGLRLAFFCSLACCLLTEATPAAAAAKGDPDGPDLVRQALKQEIDGSPESRQRLLKTAIRNGTDSREARWQVGQVQQDAEWVDYAAAAERLSAQEAVRQYRAIRDEYPMTYRGQRDLADWCRRQQLPERERAHLTAALQLSDNPDDKALRARLGQKMVGGVWTTQQQILSQKQSRREAKRNLRLWQARVQRNAGQLDARRKEAREQALQELKSIRDPDALPALQAVLAGGGLQQSRLLVELLADMKTHKAADALARLAVLSPWDVVREEASKQLRWREIEAFAPELLASLHTPIDSRITLYVGSGGVHLLSRASSETQHRGQLVLGRSSTLIAPVVQSRIDSAPELARVRSRVNRATANAALQARLQAHALQRDAAARNDAITEWNDRVCNVLKEGTGVELPPDPEEWWAWWRDYNQMSEEEEEEKEYQCRYYYQTRVEEVPVAAPTVIPTPEQAPAPTPTPNPRECLVAGTPVWTDRGYVPVEEVAVGDLVLARHAETGELRYQPVLRTTIRDDQPVMTAHTTAGTISATGAHTFWVSGRGWTKLREVKPGERFHGATGPVAIERLEEGETQKTYNLVVADLHTFFVGRAMILSHDLTFAEPTDAAVPGLVLLSD